MTFTPPKTERGGDGDDKGSEHAKHTVLKCVSVLMPFETFAQPLATYDESTQVETPIGWDFNTKAFSITGYVVPETFHHYGGYAPN